MRSDAIVISRRDGRFFSASKLWFVIGGGWLSFDVWIKGFFPINAFSLSGVCVFCQCGCKALHELNCTRYNQSHWRHIFISNFNPVPETIATIPKPCATNQMRHKQFIIWIWGHKLKVNTQHSCCESFYLSMTSLENIQQSIKSSHFTNKLIKDLLLIRYTLINLKTFKFLFDFWSKKS